VWFIRALIILVSVIGLLWLGMQNAGERVDFRFFTKELTGLSLNLFMLLVFVAGMVLSFLIAAVSELQLRSRMAQSRREVTRLERELAALRNLPLDDTEPVRVEPEV